MQINYESHNIEKWFSDFNNMSKKIGLELTRSIKKHHDRIKAAPNFQEFLNLGLGKPHSLTGELRGYYGVSVSANVRLIVKPLFTNNSLEELKECNVITVKGVSDYHGGKENWIIP
ncbi:MAG: hypothetical protein ACYCX2_05110 [Christensenellales bacterium]